jgi:hypothetical protein
MYQLTNLYVDFIKCKRKSVISHILVAQPTMVMCIFFIHCAAILLPLGTWDLPDSLQDALIIHALSAFVPEVIGSVFVLVQKFLKKLFDD